MNLLKVVEFIFILMVLVFLAIFSIFFLICLEVYQFLAAVDAPLSFRIITLTVMALVFIYILRGIISKAEDYRNNHE